MFVLAVIYENCTGCHLCELACSFKHHGVFDLSLSRITILTRPEVQTSVQVYCLQCRDAACERVCPVNAISRDKNGAYIINYDCCIGCRECAYACPFGAISFEVEARPIKCDLCEGEPECVAVCPHDAIVCMEEKKAVRELKKAKAAGVAYGLYGGKETSEHPRKKAEEAVEYLMELVEKSGELDV